MALDGNSIVQIKSMQAEALDVCKNEMSAQLDVFQEILTNINDWANETAVGQDVAKNIIEIINEIVKMIDSTDSACKSIDDFCNKQEQFNVH